VFVILFILPTWTKRAKAIDKPKAQGGSMVCDEIYSICEEEMMAPTSYII
jgi:hypothetical protein